MYNKGLEETWMVGSSLSLSAYSRSSTCPLQQERDSTKWPRSKYIYPIIRRIPEIYLKASLLQFSNQNQLSLYSYPRMDEISKTTKQVFILSGQSNMAGRGGVCKDHHHHNRQYWDKVVPPECQPHQDIHRLSVNLQWEQAHEPLHADIDSKKVCGVGPGMSFANMVREKIGVVVGLVPCAVGATAIKQWARGEVLYENMVKRAKEGVEDGGEIKGLLWYQGESDTSHIHDADVYQENMEKLIENVREDLGLPSLPIIMVAIISGDGIYVEKVREAQLRINLPNVLCVDARGLHLKEDRLHLTTEAQVELGHLLADAYLNNFAS